jgi:hypothetical protein
MHLPQPLGEDFPVIPISVIDADCGSAENPWKRRTFIFQGLAAYLDEAVG